MSLRISIVLSLYLCLAALTPAPLAAQAPAAHLTILNRAGSAVWQLTDGDTVRLQVISTNVARPTAVTFLLETDNIVLGACTIPGGEATCTTEPVSSLGWAWDKQAQRQPLRRITARAANLPGVPAVEVLVAPRPIVLVHGLNSSSGAWDAYTGPTGFLTALALHGYAVGDGQVEGALKVGRPEQPASPTNTIATNAQILGAYIARVKRVTGAEQVDLVAHSMGGLISRYYLDRLMQIRDVAQLITLGTPHEGTACANLPAALGFYLPATLELRPSYIRDIFNRQITHQRGVQIHLVAGTLTSREVQALCTDVPNDLVVAHTSAAGAWTGLEEASVWHNDLTTSAQVFEDFVNPLLRKSAGEFPDEPDPPAITEATPELQFTRIFTGHIASGASVTRVLNLDRATVASFALFDPSGSLEVTVRGASGNILPLDTANNGLIVIKDPTALVQLGYGFENPRPGPWQITLHTTAQSPAEGVDYAITAQLRGGATLHTQASILLPQVSEPVQLTARLDLAGAPLVIREARAVIQRPDGGQDSVPLVWDGSQAVASWRPTLPGLYGIDITVSGEASDGVVERVGFLAIEAQPLPHLMHMRHQLVGGGVVMLALALGWGIIARRKRRPAR